MRTRVSTYNKLPVLWLQPLVSHPACWIVPTKQYLELCVVKLLCFTCNKEREKPFGYVYIYIYIYYCIVQRRQLELCTVASTVVSTVVSIVVSINRNSRFIVESSRP